MTSGFCCFPFILIFTSCAFLTSSPAPYISSFSSNLKTRMAFRRNPTNAFALIIDYFQSLAKIFCRLNSLALFYSFCLPFCRSCTLKIYQALLMIKFNVLSSFLSSKWDGCWLSTNCNAFLPVPLWFHPPSIPAEQPTILLMSLLDNSPSCIFLADVLLSCTLSHGIFSYSFDYSLLQMTSHSTVYSWANQTISLRFRLLSCTMWMGSVIF